MVAAQASRNEQSLFKLSAKSEHSILDASMGAGLAATQPA